MEGNRRAEDKVIEITHDGKPVGWMKQSFADELKRLDDKAFRNMMYRKSEVARPRRLQQAKDRVIFAYILVGKTRKMCWYNRETGKAYKVGNNYEKTWMEWKTFQFIRYCTGFDL